MMVTVDGASGPFVVTQPNTAVTWTALSNRSITWDPAGTAGSPVNCANVDILLSVDGGSSWPYSLATSTANDGSETVQLPDVSTTQARVMVRANGNIFFDVGDVDFTITAPEQLLIQAKVWLEGPYQSGGMMNDDLRAAGVLPTAEPYTAMGFMQAGNGGGETCLPQVFNTSGGDAIVDWVRLELRDDASPGTVVCSRQALLQRDGDVVDTDGSSPVVFDAPAGNYHVAVRHRNHLGCMTANAVALGSSPVLVDFTATSTTTYGTDARKNVDGNMVLWQGNTVPDDLLKYTGADNDRDAIISQLGGTNPNAVLNGYYLEDGNMDGEVKYTGTANDRDPILLNLGSTLATATRTEQLP
jgi:hypothetical protein